MIHTTFQGKRPGGSGEEDFNKAFFHICAWRLPWSCDRDQINKTSFPFCLEAACEILLKLAELFQRRIHLKMLTDDGRTTETTIL